MEIISKAQALSDGLKFFYTGRTCRSGHDSPRYVSNNSCVECVKVHDSQRAAFSEFRIEQIEQAKRMELLAAGDLQAYLAWERHNQGIKDAERLLKGQSRKPAREMGKRFRLSHLNWSAQHGHEW